jgi:hypothetical protein
MILSTPSDRWIFAISPGILFSSFAVTWMPRWAFSSKDFMGLVSGRSRKTSPQKFSEKWITVE